MATPLELLLNGYRQSVAETSAATGLTVARSLRSTWRPSDSATSFERFTSQASRAILVGSTRTKALAREVYALQTADLGGVVPWTAPPIPEEKILASLHSTAGKALNEGKPIEVAQSLAMGATVRQVTQATQQAIIDTSLADRRANLAYMLITGPYPCWFCAMLASRGPVYAADSMDDSDPRFVGPGTAKVHDNCGCGLMVVRKRDEAQMQAWKALEAEWYEVTSKVWGTTEVVGKNGERRWVSNKAIAWRRHWAKKNPRVREARWERFAVA